MPSKRIKKPIRRKKKSDYPGEMSFRKALGMNPVYMQTGGDKDNNMDGMMKARIAYAVMHGNPSAKRMVIPTDNPYIFQGTEPYTTPDMKGEPGTHYMFSEGNYAIPTIQQDSLGNLFYNVNAGPTDKEAIRFERPEDAEYFAKNYKSVAPAFRKTYQKGGKLYYQEDNSTIPVTVKYGSPEYEQAYNQGTLTTRFSGDPEDFVRARTLPEFKVTPQYTSLYNDLGYLALEGSKGLAELTGVPGTVRFARNPVQSLKGAGNTLVDLGMTIAPFARMNPAGGIQYATQGVNPLTGEGSYRAEDVEGAVNTLDALGTATVLGSALKAPVTAGMKQAGRYATKHTPLRDAWRLNPNAYQYNLPENTMWRGIGKEGMEDASQSGVFRPKNAANTKKGFVSPDGQVFSFGKSFDKTYYSPDFKIADRYGKGFIAEVPNNSAEFTRRYSKDWSYHTQSQIPVEQGRILQKDWLRGYKPIEVPRQLPGSPNAISSVDDVGRGLTNTNQLSPPPNQIFIDDNVGINLQKGSKKVKKNIYKKTETVNENGFDIKTRYRGNKNVPADITVTGKSGSWQLKPNTAAGDNIWYFSADMSNPLESGKAMLKINQKFPFPKPTILEPKNLSLDSYTNLLNLGKRKDWVSTFENYIPLNYSAKHSKVLKGLNIKNTPSTSIFNTKKEAEEVVNRVNDFLSKKGIVQPARIFEDKITNTFGVEIPNFRLQRQYRNGGTMGNNGMFDMSNPNIHKSLASTMGLGAAGTYGANQLMNQQQMRRQGGKLYYQEDFGLLPKAQPLLQVPIERPDALKVHMNIDPNAKYEEKKKSDVLDLDNALDYLVDTRGGTRDLWGRMADTIGYHESWHSMDPGQLQQGGGPGRGIFQFEAPSLVTAQNRYRRIADRLSLKTDPEILNAKSAIELSPEQQYALFLINIAESKAPLKDYADNKLSLVDLWLQGHKNVERVGNRESFRTSVQKAKDESIQKGYDSFKELGGKLYYQEDVGQLPTLYVDPNDPEGVSRYEAYQDSLSKFKKGDRNYLTRMSYGPAGLQRPYWRKTRTVDLPPGYIVPNQTNQPIGRKITEASFPQLVDPVTKQRFGKEYFRKVLDIYAEPRQPVEYLSKSNNTSTVNKPSNSVSAPSRNFRETISQVPYINPMTGETETRVVLRTPKDEFMMNLEQYGKLGADSIPKEGNYIFKRRTYARGGSLTSAQDTAQAADLNKDVARKDTKKASAFEDFMAFNYGVGAGFLDTISFGATNELTDAGFKALQSAAGHDVNSEEAKRQAGLKGWGNIGGAVGGAFLNPGAMGSAIEEGTEGLGQGIKGIDPNSPTATGIGTALEGISNTKGFTGLNDKDKIPEGMEGFSKIFMARNGGRFRYGYQGGGHMLNQNMGLTEIDGPSHEEGGVTLPNNGGRPDVEVEGPETIYTPENYVMSEKMKASLEALEFAGITGKAAKRLAGKSYADLSKMIKSKAGDKLRPNDPLSKKMLDKEMKKLMMAHEYDREAKRMQDEAMRSQMMGGSNIIAETPEERAGGYNMYPNAQSIAFPGSGPTSVVPTYNNDPIMVTGADGSQQMLTDEPIETQAPFIEEKMAQGGKMIKRADGSYSRRGLWDNIRANRGSGKKPTKQMLEQEAKIKAAEKAYGGYYAEGGSFDNPGFRALPGYVQAKIKSNSAYGGQMFQDGGMVSKDKALKEYNDFKAYVEKARQAIGTNDTKTLKELGLRGMYDEDDLARDFGELQRLRKQAGLGIIEEGKILFPHVGQQMRGTVNQWLGTNFEVGGYMGDYIGDDDTMEYGEGGYTVRRSNDRKGKTHVVIGPDGTKKYFGDPKLGERGKSKYGKDAFYARHKKNLAKNPYFRAYARATWEDGGYMDMLNANVDIPDMEAPMYAYGGPMMYAQGGIHIAPSKRGTFKAQASKMGMGVQEAARTILNAPEGKYSPAMRKKANFARNFAKEYGGYYQMGGEMMQAPQQGQPQGGGGEEQILQQVAQMLQQGMSPEEIVGQLVQMGVPQEQAIQIVQMVVQQMQGQQQAPQQEPQQAPPMMRGGGYMYQMGGEMAPQQQAQGGEEQIVQAIMQMLQQGMQPEEIVAQLVQMGLPQEAAIQAVQMVMQQSQQGQQQQMPAQAPAPMMRYGGRVTKQMGGSLADNYLSQVNQYPVLKRNGGKLYYQEEEGFMPKVYIPGAYTPPTSIGFNVEPPVNMMQPTSVKNNYGRNSSEFDSFPSKQDFKNIKASPGVLNNYRRDPSLFKIPLGTPSSDTPANDTEPSLPEYKSPMGNYIAGGVGSMFGPLANIAAAAFAPDPTYTAAPKFKKFDYTPVALQRAAGNQAMANTRQAIRMGAPTQGSYLANVGVSMPSAGAQIGSQVAQTRYGIDSQNIGLMNQEAQLRAAQAEKNALMKDQSISNRWKLGMEAAAGVGRNIQGFSKDMGAKEMQDQLLNQLRTGDFAIIGYDNVNGTLVPKLAPTGVATYNDGTITLSNGQRARRNADTGKYEIIPQ